MIPKKKNEQSSWHNKPKMLKQSGLHPFLYHHHDGQEYLTYNMKKWMMYINLIPNDLSNQYTTLTVLTYKILKQYLTFLKLFIYIEIFK